MTTSLVKFSPVSSHPESSDSSVICHSTVWERKTLHHPHHLPQFTLHLSPLHPNSIYIYNMAICSNRFIALCHQSLNLHLGILDSCHFKGLYVNGLGLVISEVLMWPAVMQLHRAKREMPFWGQISGLFGQSPARAALCWGIMCCWICCISTAVKFSNQCKWECRIGYVWLSWWKYFLNLQHRRWHWTVSAQHWTDSNWITALPFFVVLIIELLYSSIWILKLILISGDYPCKAVLTQSILHKRL